jgi:hypothetical protein
MAVTNKSQRRSVERELAYHNQVLADPEVLYLAWDFVNKFSLHTYRQNNRAIKENNNAITLVVEEAVQEFYALLEASKTNRTFSSEDISVLEEPIGKSAIVSFGLRNFTEHSLQEIVTLHSLGWLVDEKSIRYDFLQLCQAIVAAHRLRLAGWEKRYVLRGKLKGDESTAVWLADVYLECGGLHKKGWTTSIVENDK